MSEAGDGKGNKTGHQRGCDKDQNCQQAGQYAEIGQGSADALIDIVQGQFGDQKPVLTEHFQWPDHADDIHAIRGEVVGDPAELLRRQGMTLIAADRRIEGHTAGEQCGLNTAAGIQQIVAVSLLCKGTGQGQQIISMQLQHHNAGNPAVVIRHRCAQPQGCPGRRGVGFQPGQMVFPVCQCAADDSSQAAAGIRAGHQITAQIVFTGQGEENGAAAVNQQHIVQVGITAGQGKQLAAVRRGDIFPLR